MGSTAGFGGAGGCGAAVTTGAGGATGVVCGLELPPHAPSRIQSPTPKVFRIILGRSPGAGSNAGPGGAVKQGPCPVEFVSQLGGQDNNAGATGSTVNSIGSTITVGTTWATARARRRDGVPPCRAPRVSRLCARL